MDHRIASARPLGRALTATVGRLRPGSGGVLPGAGRSRANQEAGGQAGARCQARPATAGATAAARGRARSAAAHVFAVDEGLRQRQGHQQQASLRRDQGRPARKRHAGRDRAAVRAGRPAEDAARHRAARHAAAARHPRHHRPGPAGQRALQDLLPGRLHVGLSGERRHDQAVEEGQDAHRAGDQHAGQPISLPLPLNDFAKAYDGPPTDPKVFEEQQRKLQAELQKKAEEARKKLEQQQPAQAAPAPKK